MLVMQIILVKNVIRSAGNIMEIVISNSNSNRLPYLIILFFLIRFLSMREKGIAKILLELPELTTESKLYQFFNWLAPEHSRSIKQYALLLGLHVESIQMIQSSSWDHSPLRE